MRIPLALLLLCGALNGAAAQDSGLNPLLGLDLGGLSATRTLPLFTPSRAPPTVAEPPEPEVIVYEPEPEPVREADPEPPALQLVGIVRTPAQRVAILVDRGTGTVHRLRPGDDNAGWTLSAVDPRSVTFELGDRSHSLSLFTGAGGATAVAAGEDTETLAGEGGGSNEAGEIWR